MKELPISKNDFIPCETCVNILTGVCFDDCVKDSEFKHYHQRPGTDIAEMPPFPLQDVLKYNDSRYRLVSICVYLAAVVDYLQHMKEYEVNRIYYKSTGANWEDYSI